MEVNGVRYKTIWLENNPSADIIEPVVKVIDQRYLPHQFIIEELRNVDEVAKAIKEMHIRGAGLIGATAGYGMYLAAHSGGAFEKFEAFREDESFRSYMWGAGKKLKETRPTAVNLAQAVDRQIDEMSKGGSLEERVKIALKTANIIASEDEEYCRQIGLKGLDLIEEIGASRHADKMKRGEPINIMTHCNAGWLAFVDYGSALSPVYAAHDLGIPVHVWVSETRPRNQGANLTAWELENHGVPYTLIADNFAGHLMQRGDVDLCIVGADRVTSRGDVANKIGTYLKAVAAKENKVPFYVAFPSSTFDWKIKTGKEIPIEERDSSEVKYAEGLSEHGRSRVLLSPEKSKAVNYGFDVTPAKYITGLITERGICEANEDSIRKSFPEKF